ncbi:MAG: hypothetical protein ACQEQV_09650, partial [Fibrobacterota bacterium]
LQKKVADQDVKIETLETKNDSLIKENRKLTGENTKLTKENERLSSELKSSKRLADQYAQKIKSLERQNTVSSSAKEPAGKTLTVDFPVTARLLSKKRHDATSVAANIVFYNGSTRDLEGFTANLKFMNGTRVLHEVVVENTNPVESGENVSWYGAIPYDMTDNGQALFYNLDADDLSIDVEVHSIVTSSGQVKNFLK